MNGVKESLRESREPLWCGMAYIARASYATQDRLCGGLGEMGAREMWCEVHLSRRSTLASWLAGGDARFGMADCSYARTTGYLYVGSIFFSFRGVQRRETVNLMASRFVWSTVRRSWRAVCKHRRIAR